MVRKSWNVPHQFVQSAIRRTQSSCPLWGSARLTYTLCAFIVLTLHVAMRNMLGLIILRMVRPHPEDVLMQSKHDDVERLDGLPWTRNQELTFAGTFYYGYVVMLPVAGCLTDKFGGKLLLISSLAIQAVSYLALPVMAKYSFGAAVGCLVFAGMCAGTGNPPLYQLFVVWAHPTERTAMLSFAYSGIIAGTMLIYPVASFLADFGWPTPFYVLGGVSLGFGICCHWLIYNSLDEHPRLTAVEKEYLQPIHPRQSAQQLSIPWRSLATSMPAWAFILTHVFHNYGFIILALVMPRFLREAMSFSLKEIGLLSSAPYLGCSISKISCVLCCGYVEKLVSSKLTSLRRILYGVSNLVTSACIGMIIYATSDQKVLVILMYVVMGATMDMGFSGGYWPTLLYFAPSYSGLLSGIANCFAHLCGFIAPYGITMIVQSGTKTEWNLILLTLIVFYALGVVVFSIWGTSKLQPWDARYASKTENDTANA